MSPTIHLQHRQCDMILLRSLAGIAASIFLTSLIVELTEFALVALLNGGPTTDPETYLAIRNRDAVLAAKVGYNCLGGVVGGYFGAWIGGRRPLANAAIAATVQTILFVAAFLDPALRLSTPVWAWISFAVTTAIGIMVGGWLFGRRVQRARQRAMARALDASMAATLNTSPQ